MVAGLFQKATEPGLLKARKNHPFKGGFFKARFSRLFYQTFFLQSAQSRGRDINFDFFTINDDGLFLDVWFENLAGFVLGERDIVPIHLPLATNFADCHYFFSFTVLTLSLIHI